MSGPRVPTIFDKDLWGQREERMLDLCARSLSKLRNCSGLSKEKEPEINRKLFMCMLEANRELVAVGKGFDHVPQPESANLPDPQDQRRAGWEAKVPDFQWQIIDHLAPACESARCYTIECKRLGRPSSRQWILNEEYVTNGMCRFDRATIQDESFFHGMVTIILSTNRSVPEPVAPCLATAANSVRMRGMSRIERQALLA